MAIVERAKPLGGSIVRTIVAENSQSTSHDIKIYTDKWATLTDENFITELSVKGTGSVNTAVAGSGNFPEYWIRPRHSYNPQTGILTMTGMSAIGSGIGYSRAMTAYATVYLLEIK